MTEDGESLEIFVVGNEGIVGISLSLWGDSTPSRAVVQSAGTTCRLLGQRLKDEFHRQGKLPHLMLRYTQSLNYPDGPNRGMQSPVWRQLFCPVILDTNLNTPAQSDLFTFWRRYG